MSVVCCKKCGGEFLGDEVVCPHCGARRVGKRGFYWLIFSLPFVVVYIFLLIVWLMDRMR